MNEVSKHNMSLKSKKIGPTCTEVGAQASLITPPPLGVRLVMPNMGLNHLCIDMYDLSTKNDAKIAQKSSFFLLQEHHKATPDGCI